MRVALLLLFVVVVVVSQKGESVLEAEDNVMGFDKNMSMSLLELSTATKFETWHAVPEALFFFAVFATFVSKYFQTAGGYQFSKKWIIVARAFPTYEMWRGAHVKRDNPGVNEVCRDFGKEGSPANECYQAMLDQFGDKTWNDPNLYQSKFQLSSLAYSWQQPLLLFALIVITIHSISAYQSDTGHYNRGATLSAVSQCPPLWSSERQTTFQGSGGSFFNGDVDNIFGLQCDSSRLVNAVCPMTCRPNYATSSHYGNVAACAWSPNLLSVVWIPIGTNSLAYQKMCSPDILMATPNLQLHLRTDLAISNQAITDYSGFFRHASIFDSSVPGVAATTAESGGTYLTFSGTSNSFFTAKSLPGERMHIESLRFTGDLVTFGIFAVLQPSTVDDYLTFTDILDLSALFPTNKDANCRPVQGEAVLISIVAFHDATTQYASVRVNGRNCNKGTYGTRADNKQTVTGDWHNFENSIDSSINIGCGFSEASPGTACASGNQYTGEFFELALYTNVNFDPTQTCGTAEGRNLGDSTNCSRFKLEAIEMFLLTKFSIDLDADFSATTCKKHCTTSASCSATLPYCSMGLDPAN